MSNRRGRKSEGKAEPRENLIEFLQRVLPPEKVTEASNIADGVREAGARYDRYAEQREPYRKRADRLRKIEEGANDLGAALIGLDAMSRDFIANRIGPRAIEEYIGSFVTLTFAAKRLRMEIQERGKPRDVARERWIRDMADIFENAFDETASMSGSGGSPIEQRGKFYRLLDLSRPSRLAQYGNLSPKYVKHVLAARKPASSAAAENRTDWSCVSPCRKQVRRAGVKLSL
jgi:hypothetical protein